MTAASDLELCGRLRAKVLTVQPSSESGQLLTAAAEAIERLTARVGELEGALIFVTTTLHPTGLFNAADAADKFAPEELGQGLRMMAHNEQAVVDLAWKFTNSAGAQS